MNRSHLLLTALIALLLAVAADAQGFYRNGVWRNPYTGQLEINDYTQTYRPGFGTRSSPDFFGVRRDPYTGTIVETRVQRNPFTGRLEVANDFYNPYTGARTESARRFNPFTQRYETTANFTPPYRLPPDVAGGPPADGGYAPPPETIRPPKTPERPKIIETYNPLLVPTLPPDVKPQPSVPKKEE